MKCPKTLKELEKNSKFVRDVGYTECSVSELESFNILHLYPSEVLGDENNGYDDSRLFEIWAFNTESKLAAKSKRYHDALWLVKADTIRVHYDGSILVRLVSPVQSCELSSQAPCFVNYI